MHRFLLGAVAALSFATAAAANSDVPLDCQEGPAAEWPAITVAGRLAGNSGVQVCIIGQADKQGGEEMNRKLSLARAEAVGQYLAGRGVPQRQHLYGWRGEAFGGSDVFGLFDGDEAAGEQDDRRVEIFVVHYGQQGRD